MATKTISVSRQYAPLRVCVDICFYFYVAFVLTLSVAYYHPDEHSVITYITSIVSPWSLQLSIFVAACFVVGLFIVRLENTFLRFILSLLPGLIFFFCPFQPIILFHVAAWLYFVIFMTIGNFEIHLDVYRRRIRLMLIAAALVTCYLIIFHLGCDDWYEKWFLGGEAFGLLFFVFSVLSMRCMRLTTGAPISLTALNAAYVVAMPTLLILAFFPLRVFVPSLSSLITLFSRLLIWIIRKGEKPPEYSIPNEEYIDNRFKAGNEEESSIILSGKGKSPTDEMTQGANLHLGFDRNILFFILIAVAVVVLIIIAVTLIRRRKKCATDPLVASENIERIPSKGLFSRMRNELSIPSGVRQIRKIYRSYLDYLNSHFIRINSSDTSQDVLDSSKRYFDISENETLRELYISARYGDPNAVSNEQIREAKRCLSVIETKKAQIDVQKVGGENDELETSAV